MSENSSNSRDTSLSRRHVVGLLFGLPIWVVASFFLAQLIVTGLIWGAAEAGVTFDDGNAAFQTSATAFVYGLTVLIVVGLPWLIRRRITTREELGLTRLATWMDILLTPAGFAIYLLASAGLIAAISTVVPGFNSAEAQEIGFKNTLYGSELMLAFVTLVVIAPIAEEILFRGYLYGKLKKHVPFWVAMVVTSALFGAVHGQWNVTVDTFALGIVMCGLREVTGNIWAGTLLHMMKNSVAFYFLFINPSLLNTLGG